MREVISLQRTSFQQKSFFLQRKNCLCNLWTCIYIYKKIKLLFISLSPCLQHEICMYKGQTNALNILEEILSEENGSQPPHNLKRGCNKLYGSNQQGLASPGPESRSKQHAGIWNRNETCGELWQQGVLMENKHKQLGKQDCSAGLGS